ncbi:major facilitator superfamily transporter [Xylaria bambusicola]|uniref:major facilitator superfamily transporter n=1 Tax=Xylaria bambusicola TaxID=326684 RepID=UPI0020078BCB|nr:major facilitator superfamily transporter [Xylaria bambusicola]KAI0503141.1 major facilitator superfamily transporter [Xylaria bambusicola]
MSDSESLDLPQSLEEVSTRLSRRSSNGVSMQREGTRGQASNIIRIISNQDAEYRYRIEEADNRIQPNKGWSCHSIHDTTEKKIISWEPDDKENPYNWSNKRKLSIFIMTMAGVINSTMGSSLPSMAIPYMTQEWGITSDTQKVLPISTFLIGYVFGPLLWGPLSEHFGRRYLTIITLSLFTIWTLGCALAPNWPAFLVFRFLCGAFGSAPIAIVTGQLADIYKDFVTRGNALAFFMATTIWGPLIAPIIAGFCSTTIGWRWSFWIALIYAVVTLVPVIFLLPETYAPVLLSRRAQKIRKADPTAQVYAAFELEDKDIKQVVTRVLTRPVRMILTETIVSSTCLYLALVYAIFYISFGAFPIIFQQLYGLSPGVTGLLFLPIIGGVILALGTFFAWGSFLRKSKQRNRPWTKKEESNRVPLAAIGGPLFAISLFWLGFSAREDVHYAVPSLAGVGFGVGYQLIFMGMLNYLTDAYEIFAASASAASSSSRSYLAVLLPLATTPMFDQLGISGSLSLLGGLSLLLSGVPFVFLWKGERIRAGSAFCIALKEEKLEMERRAKLDWQRRNVADRISQEKEESP